jgi:hypothetical protein
MELGTKITMWRYMYMQNSLCLFNGSSSLMLMKLGTKGKTMYRYKSSPTFERAMTLGGRGLMLNTLSSSS